MPDSNFDPSIWNEYPNVKPPVNKLMRIEVYTPTEVNGPEISREKVHRRDCLYFDGYAWRYPNNFGMAALPNGKAIRFKPWDN